MRHEGPAPSRTRARRVLPFWPRSWKQDFRGCVTAPRGRAEAWAPHPSSAGPRVSRSRAERSRAEPWPGRGRAARSRRTRRCSTCRPCCWASCVPSWTAATARWAGAAWVSAPRGGCGAPRPGPRPRPAPPGAARRRVGGKARPAFPGERPFPGLGETHSPRDPPKICPLSLKETSGQRRLGGNSSPRETV